MTCIVAIKHDNKIFMGADSCGSNLYTKMERRDPKLAIIDGGFLIGFTTSFRMGQLLLHKLKVPKRKKNVDPYHYMVTTFIDSVRDCLTTGGWARETNKVETGGNFLVGYENEIYEIADDYQVGINSDIYAAIGCGRDFALGSLYCSAFDETNPSPFIQMGTALRAAARYSTGVTAPFFFKAITNTGKEVKC